jgi:hypothetical protein
MMIDDNEITTHDEDEVLPHVVNGLLSVTSIGFNAASLVLLAKDEQIPKCLTLASIIFCYLSITGDLVLAYKDKKACSAVTSMMSALGSGVFCFIDKKTVTVVGSLGIGATVIISQAPHL